MCAEVFIGREGAAELDGMHVGQVALQALAPRRARHQAYLVGLSLGVQPLGLLLNFSYYGLGYAVRCKSAETDGSIVLNHGRCFGGSNACICHSV